MVYVILQLKESYTLCRIFLIANYDNYRRIQ